MNALDQRVLAHIHALAPASWAGLLAFLQVDREQLDLALGRQLRARTIMVTDLGYDITGRKLPKLPDGNYSKHQLAFAEEDDEDSDVEQKPCTRCKQPRALNLFSSCKNTKDKLQCWCKICQAEDHRRRRAEGYPR